MMFRKCSLLKCEISATDISILHEDCYSLSALGFRWKRRHKKGMSNATIPTLPNICYRNSFRTVSYRRESKALKALKALILVHWQQTGSDGLHAHTQCM